MVPRKLKVGCGGELIRRILFRGQPCCTRICLTHTSPWPTTSPTPKANTDVYRVLRGQQPRLGKTQHQPHTYIEVDLRRRVNRPRSATKTVHLSLDPERDSARYCQHRENDDAAKQRSCGRGPRHLRLFGSDGRSGCLSPAPSVLRFKPCPLRNSTSLCSNDT